MKCRGRRSIRHRGVAQGGFTLIELMVSLAIIGILSAIAIPQLLLTREKARHNSCLDSLGTLNSELTNQFETFEANGAANPARDAIVAVIQRVDATNASNPRNLSEPGYVLKSSAFVPPPQTTCQVFYYPTSNGTSPVIVGTQYEAGVRSFRITLD